MLSWQLKHGVVWLIYTAILYTYNYEKIKQYQLILAIKRGETTHRPRLLLGSTFK